jgi:thiamine phosphate synthase YjbQ (UPF0047 family)
MRKSNLLIAVYNAEGQQIDLIKTNIEDVKNQLFIDTATWGLLIYEKELGIKTDLNKTLDERRSLIKSKQRGIGVVGAELIKIVVDSWTNGNVDVAFTSGTIIITFQDVNGIPSNMTDVIKAIEDIIPCHLPVTYIYKYMTWAEFDTYNKTWDEWEALNLTWAEFEEYRE